ncbi:MAG: hypothetical protein GDA53_11775 [Rhodobacteraceae bacterium]|nr:hypothetical protein [Paracoccaceae bacterium]
MKSVIVHICDKSWLGYSLVSSMSFAAVAAEQNIERKIFVGGISDADLGIARDFADAHSPGVDILPFQMADRAGFRVADFPTDRAVPVWAMGRLYLSLLLDKSWDRVLYLDGDTLAGPVPIDMGQDLQGKVFGAVEDFTYRNAYDSMFIRDGLRGRGHRYFNSGVLLIDWQKWGGQTEEDALEFYQKCVRFLKHNDQCALNHTCVGRWCPLDLSWNTGTSMLWKAEYAKKARVVHFYGSTKPWDSGRFKEHGTWTKPYQDFQKIFPLEMAVSPRTLTHELRYALRRIRYLIQSKPEDLRHLRPYLQEHYPDYIARD